MNSVWVSIYMCGIEKRVSRKLLWNFCCYCCNHCSKLAVSSGRVRRGLLRVSKIISCIRNDTPWIACRWYFMHTTRFHIEVTAIFAILTDGFSKVFYWFVHLTRTQIKRFSSKELFKLSHSNLCVVINKRVCVHAVVIIHVVKINGFSFEYLYLFRPKLEMVYLFRSSSRGKTDRNTHFLYACNKSTIYC